MDGNDGRGMMDGENAQYNAQKINEPRPPLLRPSRMLEDVLGSACGRGLCVPGEAALFRPGLSIPGRNFRTAFLRKPITSNHCRRPDGLLQIMNMKGLYRLFRCRSISGAKSSEQHHPQTELKRNPIPRGFSGKPPGLTAFRKGGRGGILLSFSSLVLRFRKGALWIFFPAIPVPVSDVFPTAGRSGRESIILCCKGLHFF